MSVLLAGVECGPAGLEHSHAPGPERHPVRDSSNRGYLLDAGWVEGGDQARDDGVVDLLAHRQEGRWSLARGDDRVMVTHLGVVDNPPGEGQGAQIQLADLLRP